MSDKEETLSKRETEVLEQLVLGLTNKEIAEVLIISSNTIKVHIRNIFRKLNVSSRTEAVHVAIQRGLIEMPGSEEVETEPDEPELEPKEVEPSNSPDSPEMVVAVETTPMPVAEGGSATKWNWRLVSGVLGILLFLLGISVLISRFMGDDEAEALAPFSETELGDRWALTNRPLSVEQANMAVVADGVNIYKIGGETAVSVIDQVQAYNVTEQVWRDLLAKPTAVTDASAALLFGQIYVLGGRLADGSLTDVVEAYSPAQDAWGEIAALPEPIAGGLALSDGDHLYLFGGWNGEAYLDTAYQYDPDGNRWRPIENMPHARAFATGQFLDEKLYVVGGFDGTNELDDCIYFDVEVMTWSDCPAMLTARGRAGATVVRNKLYVVGGGMTGGESISFSEVYDPESETWQLLNTPVLTDKEDWYGLGVANVETQIFAFGGQQDGAFVADTYILSTSFQAFIPSIQNDR